MKIFDSKQQRQIVGRVASETTVAVGEERRAPATHGWTIKRMSRVCGSTMRAVFLLRRLRGASVFVCDPWVTEQSEGTHGYRSFGATCHQSQFTSHQSQK